MRPSERLSANGRRSLEATDLPVQRKITIDDSQPLAQFMVLKDDLEDRRGSSSTKATLEYALRLAYDQLEEVRKQEQELDDTASDI